jgi:hypothetical protein
MPEVGALLPPRFIEKPRISTANGKQATVVNRFCVGAVPAAAVPKLSVRTL